MSQTYTDDVYDSTHTVATDMANIEDNFAALKSSFSGSSSPANPVAGMWWYDTTANILKLRNEANSAWLDVYDFANQRVPLAINCSNTVLAGTGIAVSGSLETGDVTVSATAVPYTAGARLLVQADGGAFSGSSYETVEAIQLDRPGTVRISFDLEAGATYSSGPSSVTAYGRIYRDRGGSVTAVGTTRSQYASSSSSGSGTVKSRATYSEDISGWLAGDKVLFRGYCVKTNIGVGMIDKIEISAGNAYGLMVVK